VKNDVQISVRLSKKLLDKLERDRKILQRRREGHLSRSEVIRRALEQYLQEVEARALFEGEM